MRDLIEPRCRLGDLRGAERLLVGGRADFLREAEDLGDDVADLLQRPADLMPKRQAVVDEGRALVHVFHGPPGLFLNALDQRGNFLRGLSGLLRQLAHLVGDYGEAQAVLTGAGRFDRGVQGKQVGLLGQIVDYLDDLADVVGALAQHCDDPRRGEDRGVDAAQSLGGLLYADRAVLYLLARPAGD